MDVLGLLSYSLHPSRYHATACYQVDELVVEPGAHSRGVGTRIVEAALRHAREEGCAEVSLSVMSANARALRLDERPGFEADALYLERHSPQG